MKFSIIILALTGAAGVFGGVLDERQLLAPRCGADNCLRGIRGSNNLLPPLAIKLADCAVFALTTVTQATVTTITTTTAVALETAMATLTVLPPTTTFIGGPINGRQVLIAERQALANSTSVVPSATSGPLPAVTSLAAGIIPLYASFCTVASQYSSVCSCVGYPGTTTTVAAPTVTITATETSTSTTTSTSTWTSIPPAPTSAPTCASWETTCGFTCANILTDNANCGACGNACLSGQLCGQGTCVDPSTYSCTRPADGSIVKCGGSCNGYCFPDINGNGYCKRSQICPGLQVCAKGEDCASGICLVNGCGQVCATVSVLCPNTSSAKMLFTKRVARESLNKRELVMTEIGEMVEWAPPS